MEVHSGRLPPAQIHHGKIHRGYWHMAESIVSGIGLPNSWLQSQGLLSLKSLWAELASLRQTAWCGPAGQVVWGGWPETGILTRFILPTRQTAS